MQRGSYLILPTRSRSASISSVNSPALPNEVIYRTPSCEVFRWKDKGWFAVEDECTVEVRQAMVGRSCIVITQESNGKIYLNAWITAATDLRQDAATDVSVSVDYNGRKDWFLIHMTAPQPAHELLNILVQVRGEAIESPSDGMLAQGNFMVHASSLATGGVDDLEEEEEEEEVLVPQTLEPILQCRVKMFLQKDNSNWANLGNSGMRLSLQMPAQRVHVYIESLKDRSVLINSTVKPDWVETINNKRVSIMISKEVGVSTVYMAQFKEEKMAAKLYEYAKHRNIGWP